MGRLLRVARGSFRVRRNLQGQSSQSLEAIVYMVHRFSDAKRDEPRPRLVKVKYRIKYFGQLRCSLRYLYQAFNLFISVACGLRNLGGGEIRCKPLPGTFAVILKRDLLRAIW